MSHKKLLRKEEFAFLTGRLRLFSICVMLTILVNCVFMTLQRPKDKDEEEDDGKNKSESADLAE